MKNLVLALSLVAFMFLGFNGTTALVAATSPLAITTLQDPPKTETKAEGKDKKSCCDKKDAKKSCDKKDGKGCCDKKEAKSCCDKKGGHKGCDGAAKTAKEEGKDKK